MVMHGMCLQGHKVYVQDRIKQAKDRIWELLNQGAHVYICGDAANMAGGISVAAAAASELAIELSL